MSPALFAGIHERKTHVSLVTKIRLQGLHYLRTAATLRQFSPKLFRAAARSIVARKSWYEDLESQGWRDVYVAGRFSQEFTAEFAHYWWGAFKGCRDEIKDYLEVGSWEGQSAVLAAWLFRNARITAVDWFANAGAETNFDHNTAPFTDRLEKVKGTTWDVLSGFAAEKRSFDVIYIDADHRFDSVLLDTILSWSLLRVGGYLVWDDYLWWVPGLIPQRCAAKPAIDAWLAARPSSVQVVFAGWQVCVRKITAEPEVLDMAFTYSVSTE
jgi:hypothetical protein